ncbi:MAG: beta-lactamase family protein [Bacteroidia bacterium]|nr:beta-lactamase family protein [Bacteroidia bacterium]
MKQYVQGHYGVRWVLIILLYVCLSACQVSRMIVYNFADIHDYKIFPKRELQAGSKKFLFSRSAHGKYPLKVSGEHFETFLQDNKTVAFLIIHNDTIQYEQYFWGYNEDNIVPSFSMAKSVVSILVGCAIDEHLIQSVNEPITNYIPELKKNGFEKVTIRHLLQMTSGIKFKENYFNPFGDAAAFYYGKNLRKKVLKMQLKHEPGKKFEYASGNTQLLAMVLERALKEKTITEYLQEKIWIPLGMEYDASWSIDQRKNGMEKAFCCLNARARDFAKIGRLYLHQGEWNGNRIVSANWVTESTKIDTTEGSVSYYQYQWWLPTPGKDFLADGFLGQYIYVYPEKKLVIVRLGKKQGKVNWWKFFREIAMYY